MERLGKVSEWNDDRGFGFIAPVDGEPARVFFHVRDYRLDGRRPEVGELVKFKAQRQPDGKWRAQTVQRTVPAVRRASPATSARRPSRPPSAIPGAVAVLAYALLIGWAIRGDRLPFEAMFLPMILSAVTYVVYALDKHAAQTGRWRTQETTLHLLELLGGWPGAWVAQQTLRHKSRKPGYRVAFWTMVVFHVAAVGAWLWTRGGEHGVARFAAGSITRLRLDSTSGTSYARLRCKPIPPFDRTRDAGASSARSAAMRLLLSALLCLLTWSALSAPPPEPMLATTYHDDVPVPAFLVSEKLDGVRARWDGRALWTRGGGRIAAPPMFTRGWPAQPMDGELWIARGRFDEVSALVRSVGTDAQAWRNVRFMVFDLPDHPGPFADRVARMQNLVSATRSTYLAMIPQQHFDTKAELDAELARVVALGGEGLMLHRRNALYRAGRSEDLLKYKPHEDAEAQVIAYLPGKGKYEGMMGALQVRTPEGRSFRIGTGFTDAQRARPPPLGAWLTYRYNGLTSTGLPRFARFMRLRDEMPPPDPKR